MRYYRQKLFEAVYALVAQGDLNMRLTLVAGCLLQLDDDDVPPGALRRFERVRDPLIAKPMVVNGRMIPRDFGEADARNAAQDVIDLLVAEMGGL